MPGPGDRDHHNVVRKQFVMICVGMLVDSVAPLIGTKLQCLVLIKSIVIVTTWSSRNIWWSKYPNKIYRPSWLTKSYSVRPAAEQVMLRWVGHKFWEIFCTNNCFIFRETACLTFVKQNLDNEIHFFVSSPFALRHTKQQQMVSSFASWRFLYLFFYKFYLNTTVENMNILWIDLTNNKAGTASLWHFNWKSMWHLAQLSVPHHLFFPRCHLRPLRVMYDHQMTRDTCLLSPSSVFRPPTLSSIISCRYLTSWTLSNSPPPLTDAWCLNSCQFGKFSIDERVAWVFTSNLIFNEMTNKK